MSGKKQASVLTEFIPFICTSAIWGQSCFLIHLASCTLPAPQQLGLGGAWGGAATSTGSHGSQLVLGALIHIRRPEIAGGCDLSCLLIWQEVSEVKVAQLSPTLCDPMDWNSPGQNTGVGSLSLLQGIFPTQ